MAFASLTSGNGVHALINSNCLVLMSYWVIVRNLHYVAIAVALGLVKIGTNSAFNKNTWLLFWRLGGII